MLIRFSIENFLSFAESTEFSMIPGKSRVMDSHVVPAVKARDIPVLKAGIIYGANASGKSNLAKAISFSKNFILSGTWAENQAIQYKPFRLDKQYLNRPSKIEFEIRHRGKNYAFGFIFNQSQIIEEWLYETNKEKDSLIYERKQDKDKKTKFDFSGISFRKDSEAQFLKFTGAGTRKNQLFITECKVRNVKDNVSNLEDIFNVLDWFENALKIIFPATKYQKGIEFEMRDDQNLSKIFEEFLDYFNTGIQGIKLIEVDLDKDPELSEILKTGILNTSSETRNVFVTIPHRNITYAISKEKSGDIKCFKMMTSHEVKDSTETELFELAEESDGTQRIMDFIPAIMDLFKGDNVFIIDEIDRSLHPNLTYDIIDLFLSRSKGVQSQLIVTTHESGLLSQKLVRKDEIWFVVKDSNGASSLYSLEEFKVRFDKEIRKDYLLGRFKAVPVFGSRNHLTVLNN